MAARFQFSIRFLLAATVAVAAGAAVASSESSLLSGLVANSLTILFTTAAIVGVAQTEGQLRTFWIGAAAMLGAATIVASLSLWMILMYGYNSMVGVAPLAPHKLAAIWCAAPINGLFAVFFQSLFSPRPGFARFTNKALAIVLLLIALLVATFVGGMRIGEWRERDRRDREEQEEMEEMDEEMDNTNA